MILLKELRKNIPNYELIIVVPTYNEGNIAKKVIEEWYNELLKLDLKGFKFLLVDDGSTDQTVQLVKHLRLPKFNLEIFKKKNSGHGRSCIWGYKKALEENPKWILQIDSDGQCDPSFFIKFWNKIDKYSLIFGFRKTREDGLIRLLISRAISYLIYIMKKKYSKDPNVPYRLMSSKLVEEIINQKFEIDLANMLLTYKLQQIERIHWIDINFRKRFGNSSSHKFINSIMNIKQIIKNI